MRERREKSWQLVRVRKRGVVVDRKTSGKENTCERTQKSKKQVGELKATTSTSNNKVGRSISPGASLTKAGLDGP